MKFLCDEMLQRLGRWLRAAGYDTVIETQGESDRRLLQRALEEGRWLLTRDRKLLEHRGADDAVILLQSDGVEACVAELTRRMAIDWQYRPFTRCLRCNTPLVEARPEQMQQMPARVRERFDTARYCPHCRQLYWEGSHVRRMRERLRDWRRGSNLPDAMR
ncbi:MAG TPA: DUF5615 family PIN-like protein [Gammaproteobacteria bacterium]|nr:DUF5615 family PIN-like protein [Gammaproteobacteria bacterium]